MATLAAGVLALPGRAAGAQTVAQALRDPLLAAVLWRVLRDEQVTAWPDRAALDLVVSALFLNKTRLPKAPPAAVRALCGPARPLLTLAVTGAPQDQLARAVFGGNDG
ncbi:hypothetical protein GEU84_016190 [Fertoebacter nigrum]|uniref:Uncharacterized protein n=1 Tax=Fertoeibacter niger TaxID=2656921 RepID=A0A8X8H5C4_9RHOB|nr:hypothetical protein [Fertoeibacter niger]NUB45938.1 hypothetical protein [Fertoeibacter niger]